MLVQRECQLKGLMSYFPMLILHLEMLFGFLIEDRGVEKTEGILFAIIAFSQAIFLTERLR